MQSVSIRDVFGKWTVVDGPFYMKPHGKDKCWHCMCECLNDSLVRDYDLKSGKSVGCRACGSSRAWINSDTSRVRKYPNIPQEVYERITGAVDNAISRCVDPTHKRYQDWGGRGIEVKFVDRASFIDYLLDLPGYENLSLVLDRIDNDGHYEPGNLRFVTRSESQVNRRTANSGHRYYMGNGFARRFKQLHDKGISFKDIGSLYCENQSTVRNCVRELEATR